jgi:CubicO group peptidase (beta-lactamase class C family)
MSLVPTRPLLVVACLLAFPSLAQERTVIDAAKMASALNEDVRIQNFRSWEKIFPVAIVHREGDPAQFFERPQQLDVFFTYQGVTQPLDAWLQQTVTTGFLVVHKDAIVYENYWHGNTRDSKATSMSVAKSFTSALVGIAVGDGLIASVHDPITKYVDFLRGTGYDGVPIKHILQMSSGIDFTEEYDDQESDIMQMVGAVSLGTPIKEYAASRESAQRSGKHFNYASIDTNVLGFLIEAVTGMSPAQYLEEKIWRPLGMESNAYWNLDNTGTVLTFMGLNATLRDYAKFGRLYMNDGYANGRQIVPPFWVRESVRPDRCYLRLKNHYWKGWNIGYGYQWWVPKGRDGEFMAIGVWGQYIYVNPKYNLIIVKSSADPLFDVRDMQTLAAFRAIAHYLGR